MNAHGNASNGSLEKMNRLRLSFATGRTSNRAAATGHCADKTLSVERSAWEAAVGTICRICTAAVNLTGNRAMSRSEFGGHNSATNRGDGKCSGGRRPRGRGFAARLARGSLNDPVPAVAQDAFGRELVG
jgi:hypothetical protein